MIPTTVNGGDGASFGENSLRSDGCVDVEIGNPVEDQRCASSVCLYYIEHILNQWQPLMAILGASELNFMKLILIKIL